MGVFIVVHFVILVCKIDSQLHYILLFLTELCTFHLQLASSVFLGAGAGPFIFKQLFSIVSVD